MSMNFELQGEGAVIHVPSIQRELPLPELTTAYAAGLSVSIMNNLS